MGFIIEKFTFSEKKNERVNTYYMTFMLKRVKLAGNLDIISRDIFSSLDQFVTFIDRQFLVSSNLIRTLLPPKLLSESLVESPLQDREGNMQ